MQSAIASAKPDVIVNCAGFNMVDAAETQAVVALQVNAFAVRSLARAARDAGAALVQFSSDFVFDGLATAADDGRARGKPAQRLRGVEAAR